jgi:hypothetical protein
VSFSKFRDAASASRAREKPKPQASTAAGCAAALFALAGVPNASQRAKVHELQLAILFDAGFHSRVLMLGVEVFCHFLK